MVAANHAFAMNHELSTIPQQLSYYVVIKPLSVYLYQNIKN